MKSFLLFLILCTNMLFLTGCWDRTELNDLALVEGVGIDTTQDKMIELTVQLSIPKAFGGGQGMGGGGGGGGEGRQTLSRSGKGRTIVDALAILQEKLPRKVFWGHAKAIVIGEKLAKQGVRDELEFFASHPQPRPKSYVFVSKGSAKDVLALLPPLERSSAEVLRELAKSQILMKVTFIEFMDMLSGDAGAAALPMIDVLPPEKGQKQLQTIAYINRTAIFKKDKMIGEIDDAVTRGVLWLRNEIKQANITVTPKDAEGGISALMIRSRTELIPHIDDGKWKLTVKAVSEDDVILNASRWNLLNPNFIGMLEKELEKDLDNRMELALQKVQKEKNADILGFAEAFHRTYPQEWKKVKDRWDEIFPQVEVTFDTQVRVRRPGKASTPQGIPEKEVKKK
ncbi:Ger(x)C family spore germination protein [Effusibacillus consociatus]|uniref:Ger(X)C family spore germination protein n=1 Tax=Effusibacillus consociatus TaxID=1117041 RepID=A0ABV9Q1A1_9BACL